MSQDAGALPVIISELESSMNTIEGFQSVFRGVCIA